MASEFENDSTARALTDTLAETNERLAKQNSLWRRFLVGVVQGVGSAIGITVVAGILFFVLAQVLQSLETVPFLDKILNTAEHRIEQRVEEQVPSRPVQ